MGRLKMIEYKCKDCKGLVQITIVRESEKATEPNIEFCPFCGMSNFFIKERLEVEISSD